MDIQKLIQTLRSNIFLSIDSKNTKLEKRRTENYTYF